MQRGSRATCSSPTVFFFGLVACLVITLPGSAGGRIRLVTPPKPHPSDAAATARWLVSQNSWGVLSTLSVHLEGTPFGHVVSFSDGLPGDSRGIPYFYLTTMDPTATDALKDERASFTVSEISAESCHKTDPQSPTCAKLTLSGKLKLVDRTSSEGKFALSALFTKHPQMKYWPKRHKFQIFKLDIQHLFLIDWFGGAKTPTVEEYLNPTMIKLS